MRMRRRGKEGDPKIERLARLSIFADCRKSELAEIARLVDEVEVPRGRKLMVEGRPGWEAFVIEEGEATVSIGERNVASIGPGAVLGEHALAGEGYRAATVTADTDMCLLVADTRGFAALRDHGTVARRIDEQIALRSSAPPGS